MPNNNSKSNFVAGQNLKKDLKNIKSNLPHKDSTGQNTPLQPVENPKNKEQSSNKATAWIWYGAGVLMNIIGLIKGFEILQSIGMFVREIGQLGLYGALVNQNKPIMLCFSWMFNVGVL